VDLVIFAEKPVTALLLHVAKDWTGSLTVPVFLTFPQY